MSDLLPALAGSTHLRLIKPGSQGQLCPQTLGKGFLGYICKRGQLIFLLAISGLSPGPALPFDPWEWGLPTAAPALIPYVYGLSLNPIKIALVQAGTQLLQFSLLPSVPQPIGYFLISLT